MKSLISVARVTLYKYKEYVKCLNLKGISVYAHTKRWICQCFINYLSKFDDLLLLLSRVPKTLKILIIYTLMVK
jgi:hypothetical protein